MRLLVFGVACLLVADATGAEAGIIMRGSDTLRASAKDVREVRSNTRFPPPNNKCTVILEFSGGPAIPPASIREVRVARALDNLNSDLLTQVTNTTCHRSIGSNLDSLEAIVPVRLPVRQASSIQLIKGEIDLAVPTEANGGILVFSNVFSLVGKTIEHPLLKEHKIKIHVLTPEMFEARNKKLRLENETKEFEIGKQSWETLLIWKSLQASFDSKPYGTNSLMFEVEDPNEMVTSLELRKPDGSEFDLRYSWHRGPLHVRSADQLPLPGTQLRLLIAVPGSVRSYPFRIEGILLP